MPGETSDEAIRQIETAITLASGIIPDYGCDNGSEIYIRPEVWHEAFWLSETHTFVSQCIAVYKAHFGIVPMIEGKSAGTDASHLVSIGKIPTVIFGPGDYRESHTVDEKVELNQLMQAVGYYTHLVKTVLQPKEC
jgi:acetylornithine deacetylase/succinyl-diaminopimelate desuccinylase-like protein